MLTLYEELVIFLYVKCVRVPVRLNPSSWPERNNSFQLNKIPLIGRVKFNQLNQLPEKGVTSVKLQIRPEAEVSQFLGGINHLVSCLKRSWGNSLRNQV